MQSLEKIASLSSLLVLAASAWATTVVPRKSPDLRIVEPSGKEMTLSSLKGKVVVIEFLFLGSARCLRTAQTLNQLHSELGPRGFEPIGIVFGPNADMQRVRYFAGDFKLTYPVGYTNSNTVDSYLARQPNEVLNIPQIVVIDRAGIIRAQSGGKGGNPALEDENSLRTLLDGLLKEEPPPLRQNRIPHPAVHQKASVSMLQSKATLPVFRSVR